MPLSISKLEQLLSQKGFNIKQYFVIDKLCIYLNIICNNNALEYLLYIPSKYQFNVNHSKYVYEIEENDLDNPLSTITNGSIEDYTGKPDIDDLEDKYTAINLDFNKDKNDSLEEHLEKGYKRNIEINITKDDTKEIKDIYRQLNRLGLCIQTVKYKLAILYKHFICVIRRDDSLSCFIIKHYPTKNNDGLYRRKLFIVPDLEILYENMEHIETDIETIQKGIYKVLDRNHLTHTKTLQQFLEEKADIIKSSELAYNKKTEFSNYLLEFENLLIANNLSETYLLNELKNNNKYQIGNNNLSIDIENSHYISKLETKINKLSIIKHELINNINDIKEKREDTLLNIDKIMYDNQIMLYEIIKNFRLLSKIATNNI
jgi:hypothetical protein